MPRPSQLASCTLSTVRATLLAACLAFASSGCGELPEQPSPSAVPEFSEMPELADEANAGDAEAIARLRLAAEHGVEMAGRIVGGLYRRGAPGVPRDGAEAVKWYRRCALEGDRSCQFALATMFDSGVDVPQNYAEAARWRLLLAEQGSTSDQLIISHLYIEGQGVPQDYVQAHMWANLVAANSDDDDEASAAIGIRADVEAQMNATQVTDAQRLALEWKPKTWNELKER